MFINLGDLGLGYIRSNMLYHGHKIIVQQLQGTNSQLTMILMSFNGHRVLFIAG